MSVNLLMIGGCKDGKYLRIDRLEPEREIYEVQNNELANRALKSPAAYLKEINSATSMTINRSYYKKMELFHGNKNYILTVLAEQSMTIEDVMCKLVRGYNP